MVRNPENRLEPFFAELERERKRHMIANIPIRPPTSELVWKVGLLLGLGAIAWAGFEIGSGISELSKNVRTLSGIIQSK